MNPEIRNILIDLIKFCYEVELEELNEKCKKDIDYFKEGYFLVIDYTNVLDSFKNLANRKRSMKDLTLHN